MAAEAINAADKKAPAKLGLWLHLLQSARTAGVTVAFLDWV